MSRRTLLGALLLGLVAAARPAGGQARALTVSVPAGRFRAVRLRNLARHSVLSVEVRTTGHLVVLVIDAEDGRRYPSVRRPLYRGHAEGRLAFAVRVPAAGTHYLVLDNRAGATVRRVEVIVRGRGAGRPEETT